MTRIGLLVAIVFLGIAFQNSDAAAQRRVGRYRSPSGPTITPYLNYFRNEPFSWGVRDSYNQFVNPQRQLSDTLRRQQTGIRNVETRVEAVNNEVRRTREVNARPTGVGATFMNYSHYYSRGGRR